MTIERAIELAENWAGGKVNNLAPNELGEYHAAARDALQEKKAWKTWKEPAHEGNRSHAENA